jgi:prepilin-type N-terminal cleavage/methylation domain-containing protein
MVHGTPGRRGLTLVEVLIVLGLVGLLAALILPVIMQVRDAAARAQCTNNLKAIVLAVQNYADAFKDLPPLYSAPTLNGRANPQSFFLTVMPFIESNRIYYDATQNAATPGLTWTGTCGSGQIYNSCFVKCYDCPTDPINPITRPTVWGWVGASYGANFQVFGTKDWGPKYKFGEIPDGAANTVFVAERFAQFPGPEGRFIDPDGVPQQACNLWAWPANYPPRPPTTYRDPVPQNAALFAYHNAETGQGFGEVVFSQPQVGIGAYEADYRRVQSGHRGVIQAAMGDGTVRAVSGRVSRQTWQNAVTPADGQALGPDW